MVTLEGTDDLFTALLMSQAAHIQLQRHPVIILVRAWLRTYGLPTVVTNCSNNYGPFTFPGEIDPINDLNAMDGKAFTCLWQWHADP